jgi:hypothetical protein
MCIKPQSVGIDGVFLDWRYFSGYNAGANIATALKAKQLEVDGRK